MTRSVTMAASQDPEERYIPGVIGLLVLIVGVILILNALASLAAAIAVFIDGFAYVATISTQKGTPLVGVWPFIVVVLSAGRWVLAGWIAYYIARNVIHGRRWAWFVAIAVAAFGMAAAAYAESLLPLQALLMLPPWWKLAIQIPGTFMVAVLTTALVLDWLIAMNMRRAERRSA